MSWPPEIRRTPSRFRNPLGKFKIIRSSACIHCGTCADVCPTGVHRLLGKKMLPPKDEWCLGPSCKEQAFCCLTRCPKGALRMMLNPNLQAMQDYR
ncbi:MAG TPA: 4Fe-4S binding protein, partial [Candidatus Acidoferrum sp.]|nr:4Fe-4S binding protein [Candidatus Acidoferrum sp.]